MSKTINNLRDTAKELESLKRNMLMLTEEKQHKCMHKPQTDGRVVEVHNSDVNIPKKDKYPESSVVCTNCYKIFEMNSFTVNQLDTCMFTLGSMIEQIKVLAALNDEDMEDIESGYTALEHLETLKNFYADIIKKLTSGGNNNNNRQKSSKGHIGYSARQTNPQIY